MKRSSEIKLFLDTTVLISAITKRNIASFNLLLKYRGRLYTNEYVVKECIRVLKKEFGYSSELVNSALDYVRTRCEILPTPNKKEFMKIEIRDKADAPVVCSAMKKGCILIIDDEQTYEDAKRYLETKRSEML